MKKMIILVFLSLLLSGCSTTEAFRIDNNTVPENIPEESVEINEAEQPGNSTIGDVEGDINSVDLKEDEELTEKAESEHKTEEDILIPQDEVEWEQNEIKDDEIGDEIVEEIPEIEIIESFKTEVPIDIVLDIKYQNYPTSYNYLLVLSNRINIRKEPTTNSEVVRNSTLFEKINLESKVRGQFLDIYNSDGWYKVFWKVGDSINYGYIFEALGEPREFQFLKMKEAIDRLKEQVDNNKTAYISNYKNRSGIAPLYNGQTSDNYGIVRYQSAPAYINPDLNSEFRYIEDGALVTLLGEENGFVKISALNFEGEYWIPQKYISYSNSIEELNKVVVIDRKNQNQGVFEYSSGNWNLISYVFATTGEKARYKQETSLGYFMAIQTKPQFLYLDDTTREISGYAPYTIRFNGGAYIHGVPVEFNIVEGKRIDPGMKEYLYTIGTVPRSHKCVRNYTSHAKFLYEWIDIGKSAIIVIE